jgi:IS5 family transposase
MLASDTCKLPDLTKLISLVVLSLAKEDDLNQVDLDLEYDKTLKLQCLACRKSILYQTLPIKSQHDLTRLLN